MSEKQHSNSDLIYQSIVDCVSDALIFADKQGIIRIWNLGAEAVFGHTSAEAVGQSLDFIIPEKLRKAHWDGFRRAIEQGATVYGRRSIVTRSLHKNEHAIYVDMSFAVVKDHAGELIGAVAVARDVTDRHLRERYGNAADT